jgi:hypothetical protein
MHSRGINQDGLTAGLAFRRRHINYTLDSIARGLRLGTDDGQFLAGKRIEKRRFAGIRPTENADETGMEGHKRR